MKEKIKILSLILVSLLISFSFGLYYLAKEINPEGLKNEAYIILSRAIPNSKIKLNGVDYKLGLSVVVSFNSIEIESVDQTLKIEELIFKLPLWSVYFGKGLLDVQLKKITLDVLKKETKDGEFSNKVKKEKNLKILSAFERNTVNLKIQNFEHLRYPSLSFESFVAKNFTKPGVTAFEMIKKGALNNNLFQVVGEIDFQKLFSNKEAELKLYGNIKDLNISNVIKPLSFKMTFNGIIKNNASMKGVLNLKSNENFEFNSNVETDLINWDFQVEDSFFKLSSIIDDKKFNFEKSKLTLNGNVKYNIESKKLIEKLNYNVDEFKYLISKDDVINSSLKGSLINNLASLFIDSKLGRGEIKTEVSFDILETIKNLKAQIKAKDIEINKNILSLNNSFLKNNIDNIDVEIDGNDINYEGDLYQFKAKTKINKNEITSFVSSIDGEDFVIKSKGMGILSEEFILENEYKGSLAQILKFLYKKDFKINRDIKSSFSFKKNLFSTTNESIEYVGIIEPGSINHLDKEEYLSKKIPTVEWKKILKSKILKSSLNIKSNNDMNYLNLDLLLRNKDSFELHSVFNKLLDRQEKFELKYISNKKTKNLILNDSGIDQ